MTDNNNNDCFTSDDGNNADDDDNDNSDSMTDEDDDKMHDFILWLVDKIHEKHGADPEFKQQDYLSKLNDRISFYKDIMLMMQKDPLFQKIQEDATSFKEDNDELHVKEKTAMKYSANLYKELLLDDIRSVIYEDTDDQSDESDIADDATEDDDDDDDETSEEEQVTLPNMTGGRYRASY